jgi:hypothetical protein
MRLLSSLIAATGILVAAPAVAQQWPELDSIPAVEATGSSDVAVVVAIEDYAFLPDVPGAGKNAADWERFLADGLGVSQVLTLTNQQATREEILTFAHRAASATDEGGTLWFVFIGHGGPAKDGSDGLLIGADGQQNAKSMSVRGVAQTELLDILEKGDQERTVVLIDACFSGRDATGAALAKGTMPVLPVNPAPRLEGDTVVMTAAKADEFAGDLPGAGRPAFSYLVLGAMRGWANGGDGEVTADEAVTFARREMMGISGRQQTPQLTGAGSLPLTRGATERMPDTSSDDPEPAASEKARDSATVDATADATAVSAESVDGVPDSPFYASAAAGPGAIDNFGTVGFVGDFTAGVKFNGFSEGPNEWRLGLRLGLGRHRNTSAPDPGEAISGGEVFEADYDDGNVEDTGVFTFVVGPEFGRAWRNESGPGLFGDTTFMVSAFGLYGNQPNVCDSWQVDTTSGRAVTCADGAQSSNGGPGGGVSFGANIGLLRVSAQLAYLIDVDVFSSVTAGFTFDI